MDEREERISGNAVYLPVTDNLDMLDGSPSRFIDGLLLVPTGEAKNEYKRIGCFGLNGDANYKLLMETRTRKGFLRSLPRKTFTIV